VLSSGPLIPEKAPPAAGLICASCSQPLDAASQFCSRCGRPSPNAVRPHRDGDEPTYIPMRMGDVLEGKWRLERKIGEGGMGTVYLAQELALDRAVAVKILSTALAGDEEVVARFEREARLTASLEHPNIVPVYAVGRHHNRPFMVMKKLEGESLSAHLRAKRTLTVDETLPLFRQLAAGLDFVHAKGYVHRDIKAGNIFVGEDGHATLLDFGILRPSRKEDVLTRTGVVMGTPQYMSPEQALGGREIDHRTDLYALAVVLFECLTGRLPFESGNDLELIQMHAHQEAPSACAVAPWLPRGVDEVFARALSKRPLDRFTSASELGRALQAVLDPASAADPSEVSPALTSPSWRKRSAVEPFPAVPGEGHATVNVRPTPKHPASPPLEGAAPLRTSPRTRAGWLWVVGLLSLAAGAFGLGLALWPGPSGTAVEETALEPGLPPEEGSQAETLIPEESEHAAAQVGEASPVDEGDPDLADPAADEAEAAGRKEQALAQERVAEPRVKPPASRRSGKVTVVTTHRGEPWWAQVSVNGVSRGRTPWVDSLPPGKHRVRVERTGFRPIEREITVAPGQPVTLKLALKP
jgi:eukaryotic-like serine/threonine-protein kinase